MAKKRSTVAAAAAAAATSSSALGSRAWRRLRLAVLWIRKGGAFRQGALVFDLRVLPSCVKSLKTGRGRADRLYSYYGERQFSFDKTPLFHFRAPSIIRLPRIPCITSADGGFFSDEDDDAEFVFRRHYSSTTKDKEVPAVLTGTPVWEDEADGDEEDDGGIDAKAEEFIAKFYQQMRLQRQVSLLQYYNA